MGYELEGPYMVKQLVKSEIVEEPSVSRPKNCFTNVSIQSTSTLRIAMAEETISNCIGDLIASS